MLLEPCIVDYIPVVTNCKTMGPQNFGQTEGNLNFHFAGDMVTPQKRHLKKKCKCRKKSIIKLIFDVCYVALEN